MLQHIVHVTNGCDISVAPSFTTHPENLTIKVGGLAELQCAADGLPTPTISWYKDGHSITAGGRISFSAGGVKTSS